MRQLQQATLDANVRRVANDRGFEIVGLKHVGTSVVRLTAYVGNLDE